MKNRTLIFAAMLAALPLAANVNLPSIFSDHMVLQRNTEVAFWGFGKAGEKTTIKPSWTEDSYSVLPGPQGTWKLKVPTPDAGGPYEIRVEGYSTVVLKDVLIGEVWLVSGQSNMEWSARMGINNAEAEVAAANYPEIRFFQTGHATATTPQQLLFGNWTTCTPETMIDFSAVAYFFARELQKELKVPIGMINSSWGGTPAETWTPEEDIWNDPSLDEVASQMKEVPWGPVEPARLWNAMVAPLVPYGIRGALWYQGEANVGHADTYTHLMATLISAWRREWGYRFPFFFAQLAPWTYGGYGEGAALRDAQRRALSVPDTGMVMTSDITDDVTDIHPRNKQDVGLRFARLALKQVYGAYEGETMGPLYRSHTIVDHSIRVDFDHAAGGLTCPAGSPSGFEVAGEDKVFHPAEATVAGESVLVKSAQINEPVYVRFNWEDTGIPNLFNQAGLPASTFTSE